MFEAIYVYVNISSISSLLINVKKFHNKEILKLLLNLSTSQNHKKCYNWPENLLNFLPFWSMKFTKSYKFSFLISFYLFNSF